VRNASFVFSTEETNDAFVCSSVVGKTEDANAAPVAGDAAGDG
jgi:hypothetical protein